MKRALALTGLVGVAAMLAAMYAATVALDGRNARRKPHDARRAPNRAEPITDTRPRITPLSFVADAYLPEEDE